MYVCQYRCQKIYSDMEDDKPCNQGVVMTGPTAPCGCSIRVEAPNPPEMPHPATDEFREKNENFLRQYYGASSFNCCKHQSLPKMQGPTLQIHIREGAEPNAVYTVLPIPVHWEEKVKADIFRDVELAVFERVPETTPFALCHLMVVCHKHNGDSRRTVDLKKLNDSSVRQTHQTQPPIQRAMTVPPGQRKTTLDAWNRYHSVYIRKEDQGVLAMGLRAEESMFWPNIWYDLEIVALATRLPPLRRIYRHWSPSLLIIRSSMSALTTCT